VSVNVSKQEQEKPTWLYMMKALTLVLVFSFPCGHLSQPKASGQAYQ